MTLITLALFMSSLESEMETICEQQDIKGIFYKSVFFTVGYSADYCAVILQLTNKFILAYFKINVTVFIPIRWPNGIECLVLVRWIRGSSRVEPMT